MIIPRQKIKVFISSACGDELDKQKYNIVRAGLKALIEATHFAEVYVFEAEGASSASAGRHYTSSLEECDICIFLIDNKDGIPDGVQIEIDTVNKRAIKSLYYFCDQSSKEETPLQKSLKGASFAKSKVVHSFEDFVQNGATDLIEDLVMIYRQYCKGRITWSEEKTEEKHDNLVFTDFSSFSDNVVNKDVLNSIDKCKNYFSQLILEEPKESIVNTNAIDDECVKFLPILFEGKQITDNQIDGLLCELERQQSKEHFQVTRTRLNAIEAYFSGDQKKCISLLEEALTSAKAGSLPSWIIKDILIDLRNQSGYLEESENRYLVDDPYQKELDESTSLLYYPLMDRFDTRFYEKLAKGRIKYKFQSPYTITYGHDLESYANLLASSYVLSMCSGSLTHLHMLYKRIMTLSFFCAERYSNWNLRLLLLKTSIVNYNAKEIDGIERYFGDILSKMNASDAYDIYRFADNRPISYQRLNAKLEAFRITAYTLNDIQFDSVWTDLHDLILEWMRNDDAPIAIGSHIFTAIEGAYLRIGQDQIAELVLACIESHKRRFYDDLFKLISRCIKLDELSSEFKDRLLATIIEIICDENERKNINTLDRALYVLRKQNREATQNLDKAVSEHMSDFYSGTYRLETTEDEKHDMPAFIGQYTKRIETRNKTQGQGGHFTGYGDRPHKVIKAIIQQSDATFDYNLIDSAYTASLSTILSETQDIDAKMDAIDLAIFLIRSLPGVAERNKTISSEILVSKKAVESGSSIMTNLSEANLTLYALLLYSSLGEDVNIDLIEAFADIGDDELSQIKASQLLLSYLEAGRKELIPQLEAIILQHSIIWCNSPNVDVRWNTIRILFQLLRNLENKNIICNQLVKMIDSDNVYIKNSILRLVHCLKDIDNSTYDYILQKTKLDTNFVVRKVADEISC